MSADPYAGPAGRALRMAWVRLRDEATAASFKGKRIEARRTTAAPKLELHARTWNDIETHDAGGVFRDGLGHWMRVGPVAGMWTDGLLLGEIWEVREAPLDRG